MLSFQQAILEGITRTLPSRDTAGQVRLPCFPTSDDASDLSWRAPAYDDFVSPPYCTSSMPHRTLWASCVSGAAVSPILLLSRERVS
jgi:hypothetical protein